MREIWARRIALLTGGLVVALAVVFAWSQNPPRREAGVIVPPRVSVEGPAGALVPRTLIEAGEELYADLACARCHSVAGRGSARSPLDGVGTRLSEEEIRAWVTSGAPGVKGFQARHADIELTPAQRDALVAYLRSLR